MKKILLVFIVGFSLLSCSISEQIIFNADGSGKLAYTIDMSKMIAMTKDLDKTSKMTKDLTESTEKDMDSVFAFKDIGALYEKSGKEMTPEQLGNIESMKNFSMRMIVNNAKSEMKYILFTDFKSVSEMENIGSALSSIKNLSGKNTNALGNVNPEENSEIKFLFDGKSFSRTVTEKPYVEEIVEEIEYDDKVLDTVGVSEDYDYESIDTTAALDVEVYDDANDVDAAPDELESLNTMEDTEMTKEEMKKMNKEFEKMGKMMEKGLKESYFNFQYTFPKKIKKVSLSKSNYKLSDDKKTIFLKYQFEEFSKKIKNLNLNIEFEK